MAEYDNKAFNSMQNATKGKASNLFQESGFTESTYNTQSTGKERGVYDVKAYEILSEMYAADSAKNKFKNIDFNRYLELLKPSLFEERVLSREGDQEAGDFFQNIYEGDFDQFRASAMKAPMGKQTTWRDKDLRRGPGPEESPTLRESMLRKADLGPSGKY